METEGWNRAGGGGANSSTMVDVSSDPEDESDWAQYYYYAFLWKILLLLWDLSGIVIHVRNLNHHFIVKILNR